MTAASALTFDPAEHRYAYRGADVPHVTGILKDMRIAPPYPPDTGKMALGTAVHKCCWLILNNRLEIADGKEDRYPGTARALWPRLDAFRQKVDEYQMKPIAAEHLVYHDQEGYAGTLDLHCTIFGRDEAVWDYKTGRPPECTALQLAAYDMARNRDLGLPSRHRPRRRFALHLFDDDLLETGRARVTEFRDPFDYDAFLGILTHWKYVNRKGRKS